jgi:hypothetical protein
MIILIPLLCLQKAGKPSIFLFYEEALSSPNHAHASGNKYYRCLHMDDMGRHYIGTITCSMRSHYRGTYTELFTQSTNADDCFRA